MEKKKTPLSINIFYWLTNIVFVLFMLVCAATLVFNVLVYTDFFGNDMQLHVRFPVQFDLLETGVLHYVQKDVKVELVEATSSIHFFNTPSFINRSFAPVILLAMLLGFYMTWVFRKFIVNVKRGEIFNVKNILLLKNLAYALLALWVGTIVYMRVAYYYIVTPLEFENIRISDEFENFPGILFLALFIWVLSHIFVTGVRLKQDQELTI